MEKNELVLSALGRVILFPHRGRWSPSFRKDIFCGKEPWTFSSMQNPHKEHVFSILGFFCPLTYLIGESGRRNQASPAQLKNFLSLFFGIYLFGRENVFGSIVCLVLKETSLQEIGLGRGSLFSICARARMLMCQHLAPNLTIFFIWLYL